MGGSVVPRGVLRLLSLLSVVAGFAVAVASPALASGPDPSPATGLSSLRPDPAPTAPAQPVRSVTPPPPSVATPTPSSSRVGGSVKPRVVHARHVVRAHTPQPVAKPGLAALLHRLAAPALAARPRSALVIQVSRAVDRTELLLAAAALGAVVLASGSLLRLSMRPPVGRKA